jgi:hypothetical protein
MSLFSTTGEKVLDIEADMGSGLTGPPEVAGLSGIRTFLTDGANSFACATNWLTCQSRSDRS